MRTDATQPISIKNANEMAEAFLERLCEGADSKICLGDGALVRLDPRETKDLVKLMRAYIEIANALIEQNSVLKLHIAALQEIQKRPVSGWLARFLQRKAKP